MKARTVATTTNRGWKMSPTALNREFSANIGIAEMKWAEWIIVAPGHVGRTGPRGEPDLSRGHQRGGSVRSGEAPVRYPARPRAGKRPRRHTPSTRDRSGR